MNIPAYDSVNPEVDSRIRRICPQNPQPFALHLQLDKNKWRGYPSNKFGIN
jgi:hypothetical protein